ncbi:YadA-like family protein [Neisseria sicca]
MNKIFKVVWNRTIGSFVVTSELAKGRVKSSGEGAEGDVRTSEEGRLKTLFRLTALSAALLGFSEGAWAVVAPAGQVVNGSGGETAINGGNANGTGAVAVGAYSRAGTRAAPPLGLNTGAIAIGGSDQTTATYADGNNAIAIGTGANSNAAKATSIGSDTIASDQFTTALGGRAEAKARGATAIGGWTQATGQFAVAIGGSDRWGRGINTELNDGSGATLASGARSTAIGRRAMATRDDTLAFGTNAKATGVDAVAFGTNANASILKSIAIGKNTQATGEASIAIGSDDVKYGEIKATSRQGIAIGTGAKAIGDTQAVAIGPDATASGQQSTSIGNNTRAKGDSSVAIGGDDWDEAKKTVNAQYKVLTGSDMAGGYAGTEAATAAVAVGVKARATGALSTAFGPGSTASGLGASAFGVGASATQDKSVAIGAGSTTTINAEKITTATVNGITYGGFAGTNNLTHGSQVSFGSVGYERQLKNVAPGAITSTSTDAINGSQLYALHVGSGNIAKAVADALGGNAAVGIDSTNNQGTVTLPSYDVFKGNATPNATGNSATKFNTAAATNVGGALTNLNTYVNQGFAVKDNAGAAKGIVTPGESVQFADGNATTVTVETEADGNTKIKYDVKVDDKTIKVVDGKLTGTSQTHFYSVKNEDQTKGNYNNDGATGDNALAAGVDASATANGTTAVGLKAQASAESAIAVGSETKAAAKNAVVIGNKASVEAATGSIVNVNGTTTGEGSVAVGAASKASGTNATAVGQAANAFGQNSFAGGQNSKASGKSSVAIGDGANATDDSSSAVGPYAQATKSGASAFGYYANALGENSLAAGRNAQATNANAVALGNESKATGQNTIAFGNNANASQNQAMALGRNTVASAGYTVALGDEAKATAIKAIAFGSGAQATGNNSVATGVQAKAHADDALAVGSNANASGESAIALGKQSNAWKVNSLAFGNSANSNGERAIAIGLESVSNGQNAVSVGQKAYAHEHGVAIGSESNAAQAAAIAIGNKAQAMKYSSIVIGEEAKSNNSRSVVIGYHASATNPAMSASNQDTNQTVAIGAYANAWGDQSTAIGNNVYAKGNSSIAIGSDDWDTVAAKVVDGMSGKTVKEVYQDYTGDEMQTGKDSYTLTTSGEAAVAIGTKSQAEGELSTAFGTGTRAQGVASAAFGMGAKATKGNSVAIGAGSTTATDATKVNEATVNNLKYSGFAGGNNINPGDQVSFGTAGYERQLKNVAPGEISSTSTDAINGSQLYAVQNVLGNTAQTVKNILGGNAEVGENGSFTMRDIGGTGKNTIDAAIRDLNANAYKPFKLTTAKTANTNGTVQDDSLQNITSGSTITLEAGKNISLRQNGATVSINTVDNPEFTGKVTAKGGLDMGGNKITNVAKGDTASDAVNLEQLQEAMANLRVSTLTTVNNDAPFSYIDKDGRLLKREVTVDSGTGAKTVSFKHMDDSTPYTGDVTIAALNPTDPQTTTPTTVGNVKNGAKNNDAVNVSQLNKIAEAIGTQVNPDGTITAPTYNVISGDPSKTSVANYNTVGGALTALSSAVRTPLYFEGDSGEKIDRLLGSTVAVKGGQNNADKLSENNIGVVTEKNSGTLNVKLAKELTGLTSAAFSGDVTTAGTTVNGSGVTIGSGSNPVSLTAGGLSNGGNKVTNIADGVADNDAASYKQVKAAKTEVQGGTNVASVTKTDNPTDGHTVYTVNAKGAAVALDSSVDGLKLTSSENTTTNVTTYNLDLSDKTKASLTKADSALQNIGVQVNGEDAKTLNQADSKLNFVNGTGTTAENKNGTVAFNVNKSTLTAGTGGTVNAGKTGDAFATAADVAQAINEAVANSEKTSAVEKGDNTHVTAVEAGNKTTYTVHADNTTVSTKNGGKLKLTSSETTNGNLTKTTNYEIDLSDDAKAEIQKGVEAKNIVDTKGITFSGNSGSPVTKKLDETLAIKGDDTNVVTEAGTDGIKVKLKDEITVQTVNADKLKAGDSVLTNDGLNIANGDNPVSLTKSGLNNGGNKITKVAKGENEDDAVNYAQLKELADKGLTFDADGNTSTSSKKLGERVGIKGGNNITTSADNDNVTVKLNDDITLTSVTATTLKAGDSTLTNAGLVTPKVTAGNSVLEDNGLTISNGAVNAPVSLTKNGLDNGNNKIAKVAKGTADTDAVNVEQIKPLAAALNTTVGADGTVGQPSFTVKQADGTAGTPVHTVQDALNKVSDELNKGLTIAADNGNNQKINLGDTVKYTSKDKNIVTTSGTNKDIDFSLAEKITIGKTDGKKVVIDGTNGTVSGLTNKTLGDTDFATKGQAATEEQIDAAQTNLANVLGTGSTNQNGTVTVTNIGETGKITVSDAIKSVKETAEKGWNLQANGDTAEKVAAGETVTFKDGKNIKVTRDGKNITVATSDDVEFNKVTVGGSELTGAGLNTPKVTAGDSELNGSGLTISNGTAGSSVSLTKNGLNNGGNKITKVAEGTLAADSTDAVNGAQLYKVDQKANTNAENIAKGINVGGTEGSKKYALGDTVNIKGDSNIVSETVEGGVQLKLADTVKIGQDTGKPVSIDGTTGTVSGLSNITLGGTGFATSNKAATEAQLDATQVNLKNILGGNAENTNGNVTTANIGDTGKANIHEAIKSVKETAEKGWKLKVNEETSAQAEKISPDDEVAIKQGKNITVTREGKNITVATSDDVAFNKVTVGDSVLNGNGLTIANGAANAPVSLTKSGLDNGGNKASNIAKGTADTDAVNVEQLKPIAAALNTTVNPTTGEVAAPAFTVTKADGTKNTAVGTVQEALDKVGEELKKGLVIAADEGSSEKVNLGDTVTYTGTDGNIKTKTLPGGKVDFGLNDKVTLGKAGGTPIVLDGTNGTVSGLTNKTLGGTDFATKGQAATEEQLNASQVNLKNILGGNAENTNGNIAMSNIGGTNQNTVHDAIKSVKETVEKGWKLQANDDTEEKVAAGETVNFKDGKNIKVTRDGKNITVATSEDVEFNAVNATNVIAETVIAGNSVLTTDGLKIGDDSSPNQVSLTTAGLNNGGNKITKVAKGTDDTDAVNVEQIKPLATALNTTVGADGSVAAPDFTVKQADGTVSAPVHTVQEALDKVGDELNKGLKIAADNGNADKVNLGETVTYTSKDKNIVTTVANNEIDFSLADKITVGKAGQKPVVIDGTTGTVSGLTNTTLGSADFATKGQAATEEQLNETQVNLKNILGGNAANNNGNVTTNNIGGTGKDNVHEAIAAVKETADKGWNLKANDETDSEKIAAGDTVTVKQGKNIRVKRSGKDLTVETSDDVEFDHVKADSVAATSVVAESVIAGNSVLTTEGLKIGADGSPSQVSLTTAGLNNGGNKIANVAKGVADTDAVNVSQLNPIAKALNSSINPITGAIEAPVFTVTKADGTKHEAVGTIQDALDKVGEEVGKGLNIVADNGSSEKVNLGDTVKYTSKDKNIVTTSGTGKEIDFSLAEKVTIGKDAANGGKPVVIDGKEGIVSGLTNTTLGSAPLAGSDKAATEAQLDATQVNLATILGGNAANNNGNVTTSNIGGTGENNIHDAIKSVKATADKGWKLKANDEADSDSEKIAAGDTVTVKQGKNIRVKRSGKELTVETEDDVEFGTVSATTVLADSFISGNSVLSGEGLKIGVDGSPSQVSLTNAGLNNGGNKIANVAKGTADTDAVNVAQLNEQLAATEKTTTVVAGKNVTVSEKVDGNNTEYTVNADKTTISQAANGAVKVSEGAKDADGVTDYTLDLTDEAKADIAKGVAAKDAVDNKGLTFAADNGTTGAKKLGDSLSVKGDGNILTRADENGIGFSLADKITVGKAGNGNKPLVIDGTAGLISGLSNTTLGGADFATKGQAASEEQLNAAQANLAKLLGGNAANDKGNVTTTDIGGTGKDNVHDAIAAVKETADKGWNLNANDETSSEKIGAGDTVTFKEGKNVKVSRNGKHITVATSDDVSFDKVTVGDSVLTDNGLTVGNGKAGKPVSLTKDGLNNGGNKIANVAKGTDDTDAVNVAQLKAAAAKATSKVDSGNDNIGVTPEQNADGSTTYKVATAPNLKADSFTAGDTVVNNDGVKVGDKVALGKDGLKAGDVNITADGINAGNKAISNVAAGVKDTDAANVGQLNRLTAAAKTEVEAGTNIASVTSKKGKNGQTVYTVNADGASISAGSDNIVVTKGNKDADNVTDYAVDLSKAVKADIAKGVAAKDAVDNKGISFAGDSGTTVANKLGDTVAVKGDANITTTAGANGIQVGLNKDLKVDSVKAGDTVVNNNGVNVGDKVALGKDGLKAGDVNITADGINAGGKKVTGVAAGTVAAGSTDAVNGGQLHQVYELIGSNGGNVNTAPPSVEADGKAGLGNIKNITLVDNSNNPNVTNVTNETKIAQSNGYSLVTYNVEDQGMYVTNNVIEAVGRMNEQGIKFFHTNDGEVNPDVQARNSEDSSASGAYATAVGFQAASKGTNAIAIGKGAKANAENTIAIGTGNIVSGKNSGAIGDPTVVSGNSSYSIGNNNNVSADNAYALGSNIKATVNDSVYLGDRAQTQGIHTADAAKGEAYTYGGLNDKAVAGKAGSAAAANKVAGVVTVGNGTDETRQVQGVAAGVVSADSTDAINGSQLYYTNQAIANVATQATAAKTEVTAGKNVVVNQTTGNSGQTVYNVATADKLDVTSVTAGGVTVNAQGVSIAAPTAHNPANTVSLSPIGLNNGGQRITNVAPAKEGTDAVNLNQLAGVGNALQNNIERVGKKAYAGVAGAIAQGSIPQVTRPGATGIGVGSGYYGGQSAMAIGVSAMSDGGNWVVKGNFSANTDGHVGVGAGALYQW